MRKMDFRFRPNRRRLTTGLSLRRRGEYFSGASLSFFSYLYCLVRGKSGPSHTLKVRSWRLGRVTEDWGANGRAYWIEIDPGLCRLSVLRRAGAQQCCTPTVGGVR